MKIELTNIKWNTGTRVHYRDVGVTLPHRIRIMLDPSELEDNASEPLKDLIDDQVEEYFQKKWKCWVDRYDWHFV